MLLRVSISITLFSTLLMGQVDHPGMLRTETVDFGGVSGTWGHLQIHRPFGGRGIVLQEWKDLVTLHPINGEFLNTDRRGWMPHDEDASYWAQIHPVLISPADTAAPSIMVNYKQGDGDFSDFTLWYHNSMGGATRYGWTSKLRNHKRFLDYTSYYDQRHRLFLDHEMGDRKLQVEVNYDQHINPMYLLEQDTTTLGYTTRDDWGVSADRWSGSLSLQNDDSVGTGSELFVWMEGGVWSWVEGRKKSVRSMGLYRRNFQVGSLPSIRLVFGYFGGELGGYSSFQNFTEVSIPVQFGESVTLNAGLRNVGRSHWLPTIEANLISSWLKLSYSTQHLLTHQLWNPAFSALNVNHLHAELSTGWVRPYAGGWAGSSGDLSGYYAGLHLKTPWLLTGSVRASQSSTSDEWVWAGRQVEWELDHELTLFKKALNGKIRVWGRHLFDPMLGNLDPATLIVDPNSGTSAPERVLNLLNYTVSGQVSQLIIAYTGSNVLQDPNFEAYGKLPWETQFSLMSNQASNLRFRYLTLIWVFDN